MTGSRWLNTEEAAAYLGVKVWTVNDYCRRGLIMFGQVGRSRRFISEHLDRFIASNGSLKGKQVPAAETRSVGGTIWP